MADVVVCCDGTWNTPDDTENGLPSPTNVYKIFNALDVGAAPGRELSYYHPGVGTGEGTLDRVLGGGVGAGLGRNIKSAYRWLAVNYREKDRIWLFGFSRGAFTARCVAGMVTRYGLLDLSDPALGPEEIWSQVDAVYEQYREGEGNRAPGKYFNQNKKNKAKDGITPVFFIGVWDTVGALGVPDDLAFLDLLDDPTKYQFHDTTLNEHVLNARHALALDEMRQSFIPTLWTGVEGREETVKQLWFPGVHSDVGGGYAETQLSDSALLWMMEQAEDGGKGLKFHNVKGQLKGDPLGFMHDSASGVFKFLPSRPRNVPPVDVDNPGKDLHGSVLDRAKGPLLSQARYRRHLSFGNGTVDVDIFARQRWNATGLYLEEGVTYQFEARGQWEDGGIKSGPNGSADGRFEPREIAHLVSKGIGIGERAYKWLFRSDRADFAGTLRYEGADFFALIGVICNGAAGLEEQEWEQEHFLIGESATITPQASGYLYCFANDVWLAYDNNRGSVRLSVSVK